MAYAFNGAGSPPRSIPTTQDSLNVYNNALKVFNYYKNKKYKRDMDENIVEDPFYKLDKINNDWNERVKNLPKDETQTPSGSKLSKDITYRKDFDKNRFMQRELANYKLDTQAPAPLYDRRITPTIKAHFTNIDTNDSLFGDNVGIYLYDPLQVKPVKYLTPKERIARGIGGQSIQQPPSNPQPVLQIKKFVDFAKTRKKYPEMEQLTPKQASFEANIPIEDNQQLKPMLVETNKEQAGQMGAVLRYPMLQSAMEKLKMRIKGEPMLPYWMDKSGTKRYPAYGENNPQDVKMIEMLKDGLNPNNQEDAAALQRISDWMHNRKNL